MLQSKRPTRRTVLAVGAAAVCAPRLAFAAAPELVTIAGEAFGTRWSLTGARDSRLDDLRAPFAQLFDEIDRQMSPWRTDSDVSRFNAGGPGEYAVPEATARVAAAALDIARASGGAFDPTVGPAVARWGFGPIRGSEAGGWAELGASAAALTKPRAGLTLDLCGIAKGFALDRALALAAAHGQRDVLLDIGGELGSLGRHPAGRPWQVAIADPRPGIDGLYAALPLAGGAVATSGLKRQSYTLGARVYGHIIDPARREPVRGRLASVSVAARDAMSADAWATALFAAGDEAGPALATRHHLAALFLFEDGRGGLRTVTTGGLAPVVLQ